VHYTVVLYVRGGSPRIETTESPRGSLLVTVIKATRCCPKREKSRRISNDSGGSWLSPTLMPTFGALISREMYVSELPIPRYPLAAQVPWCVYVHLIYRPDRSLSLAQRSSAACVIPNLPTFDVLSSLESISIPTSLPLSAQLWHHPGSAVTRSRGRIEQDLQRLAPITIHIDHYATTSS
jgi:hypothetical protein